MNLLKDEVLANKVKLENIEKELETQIEQLHSKEENWMKIEEEVQEIVKRNNHIVRFNVGGKEFNTRLSTLVSIKETFFYRLVHSQEFDLTEVLYFDRSPRYFSIILDFLRYKTLDLKRLSKDEKFDLRFEAEFFEVTDISEKLGDLNAELEIIAFEYTGPYSYNEVTAGTNRLEDISDRSLQKGICANSPGWIIFELNDEWEITEMDLGGFAGNSSLWAPDNGNGATILTSLDKNNWVTVGSIPLGFGSNIKTIKVTKSIARYLKFNCTSYLGIGYISIKQN